MGIKYIDIIHHSHTDFGYTDHPDIAGILHKRYIDTALDAIKSTANNKSGERFCWTAEALLPVYDWWVEASEEKRNELLKAIESYSFEVQGFPFNNTAFLNDDEWDTMFSWVPDELWEKLKPVSGMQIDVNGIPSAGIVRAIRKGLRYLFVGPNSYNGRPPFATPSAFRWKMPDGSSILVWLNAGYCDAFYLFNENWREGPVPDSHDLRYRPPGKGDFFCDDEASMIKAHGMCMKNLKIIEADRGAQGDSGKSGKDANTQSNWSGGYNHERLIVSLTNQWRLDNDPPFLPIVDFVKKWNEMGFQPELRLTTPSVALNSYEKEAADSIPEYSGEWTDWWANGGASAPVEVAVSRYAKRVVKSINSKVFGKLNQWETEKMDKILKELCLFDEHTWGYWGSIAYPYSLPARMQQCEKYCHAYKPLEYAKFLLAEKARANPVFTDDGIYVTNPSGYPVSYWVELPVNCLRGKYTHIKNNKTGVEQELLYCEGVENFKRPKSPEQFSVENVSQTFADKSPNQIVTFWSDVIGANSTEHFILLTENGGESNSILPGNNDSKLRLELDSLGWPVSARWDGMDRSLFESGTGRFLSYSPVGFAPRWVLKDIFTTEDKAERIQARAKQVRKEWAAFSGKAVCLENRHTVVFEQSFCHPSLKWGFNRLEIWKDEPKARFGIKINRRPSMDPEIFYISFNLPCEGIVPNISNGGFIFKPGEGQLPGTCMDHYAIDGWAQYPSPEGTWLWSSVDAPLITFQEPNAMARLEKVPDKTHEILSIVFDNTWDTNFAADSHGIMHFTYDIIWQERLDEKNAARISESLSSEPVVTVKTR